jgi:hypothetical protein
MNSLALLLLATAATGADPQPVVQETVLPVGSYTYTEVAPESRPSLFGRIRNALSPKTSTSPSATFSGPAYPAGGSATSPVPLAPSVISTETTIAPARRFAPSGSSAEPPLADTVPVTTPAPPAEVRPATPPAVVPQPTYTYPAPAVTPAPESSRTRLFPRIRKLFGSSSSQSSQALPEGTIVTTPQIATPPAPAPTAPVIPGQPQRMPLGKP